MLKDAHTASFLLAEPSVFVIKAGMRERVFLAAVIALVADPLIFAIGPIEKKEVSSNPIPENAVPEYIPTKCPSVRST